MTASMDINQAQAWVIVGGVIVTTLAGIGTVVVGIITALRQGRTETKVDAQAVKQDQQIEVNKEIHLATNGALAVAKEALQIANSRVTQLEDSITKSGEAVPLETKQTEQKPIVLPPSILLHKLSEEEAKLQPTTEPIKP